MKSLVARWWASTSEKPMTPRATVTGRLTGWAWTSHRIRCERRPLFWKLWVKKGSWNFKNLLFSDKVMLSRTSGLVTLFIICTSTNHSLTLSFVFLRACLRNLLKRAFVETYSDLHSSNCDASKLSLAALTMCLRCKC